MLATLARRDRLDQEIAKMAADSEFTAVVAQMCCLRGISTLTGFELAITNTATPKLRCEARS